MFSAGGSTPGAGAAFLGPPEQGWGSAGVSVPPFPPQPLLRAGMSLERADFPLCSESPKTTGDLGSGEFGCPHRGLGVGSSFLLALPPASFTITSKTKPNTFPSLAPPNTHPGMGLLPPAWSGHPQPWEEVSWDPKSQSGHKGSCPWVGHPVGLGWSGGGAALWEG